MIEWKDDEEWFTFGGNGFDVAAAKRILKAKAKVKIHDLPMVDVAPFIGEPGVLRAFVMSVDWKRVQNDPTIDLSIPVIVAETRGGNAIPIDGWHRIAKAKLAGLAVIPCVFLTKKESKSIWA